MQIQNFPWECQLFSEKQGKERMVSSLRRLFATDQITILMILYSVGPTSTKIIKIEYNAIIQKEHNTISESWVNIPGLHHPYILLLCPQHTLLWAWRFNSMTHVKHLRLLTDDYSPLITSDNTGKSNSRIIKSPK